MRILGWEVMAYGKILDDGSVRAEVAPLIIADEQRPVLKVEGGEHQPRGEDEETQEHHPIPKARTRDAGLNEARCPARPAADRPDRPKCQRQKAKVGPEKRAGSRAE